MKYENRTRLTANSFFPGGKFLFLGLLELYAMAGVIELGSTWELRNVLRMLLPIRWGKLRTFVEWGSGRADSYFNSCCPSSKRSKDEWSCDIEFPKVISELNFELCFLNNNANLTRFCPPKNMFCVQTLRQVVAPVSFGRFLQQRHMRFLEPFRWMQLAVFCETLDVGLCM